MGNKIKHKPKKRKSDFQEQPQQQQQETALPEAIEYHDDFVDAANKALEKTMSYKYYVVGAVVLAFAAAVILSVMATSSQKAIAERSAVFSAGQTDYMKPVANVDAAKGDLTESFASDQEKYESVIAKMDQFLNKHNDAALSAAAHLYKGNSYLQLGQFNQAKEAYRAFSSKTENIDLKELVDLRIALIYKQEKKGSEAIKMFQALSKSDNFYIKTAALYAMGEVYEQTKKSDEAQKTFKQIVELGNKNKTETSPYTIKAQLKVAN